MVFSSKGNRKPSVKADDSTAWGEPLPTGPTLTSTFSDTGSSDNHLTGYGQVTPNAERQVMRPRERNMASAPSASHASQSHLVLDPQETGMVDPSAMASSHRDEIVPEHARQYPNFEGFKGFPRGTPQDTAESGITSSTSQPEDETRQQHSSVPGHATGVQPTRTRARQPYNHQTRDEVYSSNSPPPTHGPQNNAQSVFSPQASNLPPVVPSKHPNPFATPLDATPASTRPSSAGRNSLDHDVVPGNSSAVSRFRSKNPAVPAAAAAAAAANTPVPDAHRPNNGAYFKSRRVKRGEIERPWMDRKDPKEKWVTILPILGILIGLAICGVLIWDGLRSVSHHNYCQVLDDDFSGGFNDKVWTKEVEVGGFGNGQFEATTNTDENVFVQNGVLTIKPTLQDAKFIENDNIIDLRGDGGCTGSKWSDCLVATNTTNGTVVNPVKSGRINTKLGASIKYGKIEVTAKLPRGDWLWPAIWMLPKDSKYGEWPRSGEIDIMESRGNNYTYGQGGNNIVSSTLHFGPNAANDGWWRNNVKRESLHTTYSKKWHTFGVEWSEKYIFTYIDTRLLQVMYTQFDRPFWQQGQFPLSDSNGTRLQNPWSFTENNASPFDEEFYLIINLAVGGTNGWFKDGKSGKPWLDASPTARKDFWQAQDEWLPTWEKQGQLEIKSVKIWQQAGYNGCSR
ncbi:concanavalin A-like lectin/glucanase domain-containing protein [Dendryphion nanum]|uniref:Concanavalin A-like lectin/glucanase domain-containing protein n=1 Tax=Dendryphion nanum TaxID=256645 RepID=A0A9P9DPQ4_9PLEO|nr:concanavalin A-like lectin/glucanase domain-containing protein [Dendryphion nanum]